MLPGKKSFLLLALIFTALQGGINDYRALAAEEGKAPDHVVITGKSEGEVIIESEILFAEGEQYVPAGEYINQAGKQFWLKEWHLKPCRIPQRRETAERTVLYEEVEWEDQIPKQATVTCRDNVTGQELQKEYPILHMEFERERWLSGFTFTAVFHSYDADYYQLGTKKIPFNNHKPELKDCDQELLAEIDVEPENYRILDADWLGSSYLDENGSLCRDAEVTGEKKVADYYVTYGGEVVFPETEGVRCVAVYRGYDAVTDDWNQIGEQSVESENFSSGSEKKKGRWLVFRKSIVVTISIFLMAGVIFLLIFTVRRVCSKKKKERGQIHE